MSRALVPGAAPLGSLLFELGLQCIVHMLHSNCIFTPSVEPSSRHESSRLLQPPPSTPPSGDDMKVVHKLIYLSWSRHPASGMPSG